MLWHLNTTIISLNIFFKNQSKKCQSGSFYISRLNLGAMGSKYRTFSRSFFTLTFIHSLTGNVVFLLPSNYRPRLRGLGRPKLHSSFPVLALLPYNFYCSPTKLRGGNAFSGVCLFRMGGGGLYRAPAPAVQDPGPGQVQTCCTWTSPYRDQPQICSNLFNLDLCVEGPPTGHIQTCSL